MTEILKPLVAMWPVIILLIVVGIVVVVIKALTAKPSDHKEGKVYSYYLVDSLLTDNERGFYHLLYRSLAGRYALLAKVNVHDVLRASRDSTSRLGARGKVSQKHFDFVICDLKTLAPLAAVELDDSSHQRDNRKVRDEFLNGACASAGLRILRYRSQRELVTADLLAKLSESAGRMVR